MKAFLASPRGFCAGVTRAIATVETALVKYGAPIYVKHQIVHNRHVIEALEKKGAIFVEDLSLIPKGSVVIFSAHGVTPEVRAEAKNLSLKAIDATCPLVTKLHDAVLSFAKKGYHILLIGKKNHVETRGVVAEASDSVTVIETMEDIQKLNFPIEQKLIYLCQTTLSLFEMKAKVAALKEKFPHIESLPSKSVCYATTNRQKALLDLADICDLILVIGDPTSSNSHSLKECAEHRGKPAYLINSPDEIQLQWLHGEIQNIAISAGASTPESLVQQCIEQLTLLGVNEVVQLGLGEEKVNFPLPLFV